MVLKQILLGFGLIALLGVAGCGEETSAPSAATAAEDTVMQVYKDPNCGCCGEWITHMEERGFAAQVEHPSDLNAVKQEYGIAPRFQSCHTAVTEEGFVFEGHIPAKYVKQFLAEQPDGAVGLAVPGMPLGSPGMEVGDRFMPYEIWLLREDGSSEVYAQVESAEAQYP